MISNENVGIVVVTYNRLTLLKEAIGALKQQTYKDFKIIVVNNGSTDGTQEWLSLQVDIFTISQDNIGGAGGFFTGMKYVAEHDFCFAWIMDDDVVCHPNALEELLKAYHVRKGIGFVCSLVRGIDGRPMNTPVISNKMKTSAYSDLLDYVDKYALVGVKESTFVSVLIPTEIIRKEGLPIKEYFIWGDDSEYTERISMRYPCYVACRSIVVHKRAIQEALSFSRETNSDRLRNYFYMFRNQAYTSIKGGDFIRVSKCLIHWNLLFIQMFFNLKWKHAWIVLRSLIALLSFRPKIQYPENRYSSK